MQFDYYVPTKVIFGRDTNGFLTFLDDMLRKTGLDSIDFTKWGLDSTRASEYAKNSYDVTYALHDRYVPPMPFDDCVGIIERSLK